MAGLGQREKETVLWTTLPGSDLTLRKGRKTGSAGKTTQLLFRQTDSQTYTNFLWATVPQEEIKTVLCRS